MKAQRFLVAVCCAASLLAAPTLAQTQMPMKANAQSMAGRYYAIGDSISMDTDDAEQFPQVIVASFPGLQLTNLAVGGTGTAYALSNEVTKIPAGDPACRLVTIESGSADVRWGTPFPTLYSNFTKLYQEARRRCPHATIVIATYINNARISGEANPKPSYEGLETYNQWLRGFAEQNHIPIVYLDADTRFNHRSTPELMRNWLHPSAAGNQIVGADFVRVINEALAATP